MKHTLYKTQGTCSQLIDVTVDEQDVIQEISFTGGCGGNLQAVCRLVKGQKADEVIKKLKGIRCGDKPTSCPDQLCRALEQLQHSKE
ncbi:MAG: TIGR03905 family TSCPD domain-containing protein [Bacteroidales bacterium]|nr:TIGR03905 family TSCPD domain-containing protein [Bacteroidales bacterium]